MNLICACCGGFAPAKKQWFNQDTGFGVCSPCFQIVLIKEGREQAERCYGKEGIHHTLTFDEIGTRAFNLFKETLPEAVRGEQFHWLQSVYDIERALYLIHLGKAQGGDISVNDWAKAVGMDGPQQDKDDAYAINIITGVIDSEAMKDTIEPNKYPIIIVEHSFKAGRKTETSRIIIDGNKRLRKAFLTKQEKIKAFYLSAELAKLVKIN